MRIMRVIVMCIIKATHTLCKVNHAHCTCDVHERVHAAACILALLALALLEYLNRSLPTANDTGIGKVSTKEANRAAVTEELRRSEAA